MASRGMGLRMEESQVAPIRHQLGPQRPHVQRLVADLAWMMGDNLVLILQRRNPELQVGRVTL